MFKNWKANNAKRVDFSGEILTIPKSKDGYMRKFKLYGKTVQDGTPTPENPIPINSVPSEFDITSCGENLLDISKAYNGNSVHTSFVIDGNKVIAKYITTTATYRRIIIPLYLPVGTYTLKNNVTLPMGTGFYGGMLITPIVDAPQDAIIEVLANQLRTFSVTTAKTHYVWLYVNTGGVPVQNSTIEWYDLQLVLGSYTLETMPAYTPYRGTTNPFQIKDNRGLGADSLHELCSLPDGTRDMVDLDGGESVENVGRKVANGSESEWQVYLNDEMDDYIRFNNDLFIIDRVPALGDDTGETGRFYNNTFPIDYTAGLGEFEALSFSNYTQRMWIKIAKSRLVGYDINLTNAQKVQLFRDWLAANPVTIYYVCEPKPWTLHPDEQKKIITVDSDTAYIYTNAEVQPEISANAISY